MKHQTFIDISMPISNSVITDPEPLRPKITYTHHRQGAHQLAQIFPGVEPSDLPDAEGWAVEDITLTSHSGSHMDAPWHYHSTTNNGKTPSPTIDEAPLDLFMRPGVKLDFSAKPDGYVVNKQDIIEKLAQIDYVLQPYDIVLMQTSAGTAYGDDNYVDRGCGFGAEATRYLIEQGVKVVGTDAWSWDAPFSFTARAYQQSQDPSLIWEGHKAGRHAPYFQMEKLLHLEKLPTTGFTVCCFPIKIEQASAGWVRAVAILPQEANHAQ